MSSENKELHVVMLPWSAFGHMLPYLQLAMALANRGVRVSYISTPGNIARLPKIPLNLASLVEYVTLPMPTVSEGSLPAGAEATVDMETDEIPYLKIAYDGLYEPVKRYVSSHLPDWLISDFAAYWMPTVAQECRVPLMYFSIFPAAMMSVLGRETMRKTTQSGVAFRDFEATQLQDVLYSENASGITDVERVNRVLKGCKAIGIRSCREFEGEYIDLVQSLNNKPMVPAGMLPPGKVEKSDSGPWDEVFRWLDRQIPGSVIYVGFGSEHKLTKHQVYEIAFGLELAQLPFVWALRRPTWAADNAEALPPDFCNRMSGMGIVSFGWAPQVEILGHVSVGGSLFHAGWWSVIETLQHGHTAVMLPFVHGQGLNARLMVEKGLGVEVERGDDGSYSRNNVADALRRAMIGDEAQEIKMNAMKSAGIYCQQSLQQECYVTEFVEFLKQNKNNT